MGGGVYTSMAHTYTRTERLTDGGSYAVAECDSADDLLLTGGCTFGIAALHYRVEDGSYAPIVLSFSAPTTLYLGPEEHAWACMWTGATPAEFAPMGLKAKVICIRTDGGVGP